MPFYSWECVTLQLKHRDLDLVIRNEDDMNDFLLLILNRMQSLDNIKGTALKFLGKDGQVIRQSTEEIDQSIKKQVTIGTKINFFVRN